MDAAAIVSLVKERLGIKTAVRDTYLTAIANGVITELQDEKGLVLDEANFHHLIFVVDYVTWRYQSRDKDNGMPRHLQYRLHSLFIHLAVNRLRVDAILTVDVLPALPDLYTVYLLSTDGSKQMYIDGVWTTVDLVNGVWVVA